PVLPSPLLRAPLHQQLLLLRLLVLLQRVEQLHRPFLRHPRLLLEALGLALLRGLLLLVLRLFLLVLLGLSLPVLLLILILLILILLILLLLLLLLFLLLLLLERAQGQLEVAARVE